METLVFSFLVLVGSALGAMVVALGFEIEKAIKVRKTVQRRLNASH
jgi:hypothetical protein